MIYQDLLRLESQGKLIGVGASGAGWMGCGFVHQMAHVPGMKIVVLADSDVGRARAALVAAGVDGQMIVETGQPGLAEDAIRSGKRVVTGDYRLASQLESVDIITDVTPSPAIGAETALGAIEHGKDVVLINIEADATVGRILNHLATEVGALYSVSSGDEPGCLMELFDFVKSLGFEVIVIGKGKNNPLNPLATPDMVAKAAERDDKNPYQVASYVDGTKTMFEMTCAANATGCRPMQRGMVGPEANLNTVAQVFALAEDGGITSHPGVVDFVQGTAMAGGVFVIVRTQDKRIRNDLQYLKVGQGDYFVFFRPYHLWFIEAPISIARAYLYKQPTLVPLPEPVAEVMAIAKSDLRPGQILDDFGGYTFYGTMDLAEEVNRSNGLPVGLAPGAKVIRPVATGEVITWNDVSLDEGATVVKLRRRQDEL